MTKNPTIFILSIFFILICEVSTATELINFDNLSEHHNKEVLIRGFYYNSSDKRGVISSQPNLKTCCVGSPKQWKYQIFTDHIALSNNSSKAMTFKGELEYSPRYDQEGNKVGLYYLKNASILPEDTQPPLITWIIGIFFIVLGSIIAFKKRKQLDE
ncbi:MAG: hypothetical protein VX777_04375 [Chlamydiota bacterium]|nr:hypothetical protein [Chlamydiota bacterium]